MYYVIRLKRSRTNRSASLDFWPLTFKGILYNGTYLHYIFTVGTHFYPGNFIAESCSGGGRVQWWDSWPRIAVLFKLEIWIVLWVWLVDCAVAVFNLLPDPAKITWNALMFQWMTVVYIKCNASCRLQALTEAWCRTVLTLQRALGREGCFPPNSCWAVRIVDKHVH